jgi:hypothetical protein
LLDDGLGRTDKGEAAVAQVLDIDGVKRNLSAAGIAALGMVLRQPLVADAAFGAGAEDMGEAVLKQRLCLGHRLGIGFIDIDQHPIADVGFRRMTSCCHKRRYSR